MIMDKFIKYVIWPLLAVPAIYLAFVWNQMPHTVPIHYNLKGEPDRYGDKSELLVLLAIILAVNTGVYLLLVNIHRIDPKRKYNKENLSRMRRLAFGVCAFISVITCLIIYSSFHAPMKFDSRLIVIGTGLLFTIIGNYMYTIKPNYFAGIRVPWTLENENNWRLTHKLGGKLWFAGGLVMAIAALLLPATTLLTFMLVLIIILAVIPIVYSYRLYVKTKN
jgi:immunity protein, SdpI family